MEKKTQAHIGFEISDFMRILPEELREELKKPFGELVVEKEKIFEKLSKAKKPLIAVGDYCNFNLIGMGFLPEIIVIDFKIKRVEINNEMKQFFSQYIKNSFVVFSPPGKLSEELEDSVKKVLQEQKGSILVLGEEDLSSLLFMAYAKKGTLVYGQPDQGLVIVSLGQEISQKAKSFLEKMQKE